MWELELQMFQKECNSYIIKYDKFLLTEKEKTFEVLEKKIDLLGVEILGKLFANN